MFDHSYLTINLTQKAQKGRKQDKPQSKDSILNHTDQEQTCAITGWEREREKKQV